MDPGPKAKGQRREGAKAPPILPERSLGRKIRANRKQAGVEEKAVVQSRAAVEGNKFQPKKGKMHEGRCLLCQDLTVPAR